MTPNAGRAAEAMPPSAPAPVAARVDGLLAALAAGLSGGDDIAEVLQAFLAPVIDLAGAQGGMVRMLSDDNTTMHVVGRQGLPAHACAGLAQTHRHCGVCGAAADDGAPHWNDRTSLPPLRRDPDTSAGSCEGSPGERILAVPLQHRGELLGVYNLVYDAQQPRPAATVLSLLRPVGDLLGLALHHARLERAQLRGAILQERQRLAAEVHDSLGQSLTFVKLRLPLLEDALDSGDAARARIYCQELRTEARQAHAALRGLLTDMRAPMDPQGLQHALQVSAEAFRRRAGTQLELVNELPQLELDPERESQVFHIVQEALNNVARHARAQHVRVHIAPAGTTDVQIQIEDDGSGLGPAAGEGAHYGMQIMAERARRIGGTLEVGARCGGGTCVSLAFPLQGVA
jgi:two-component system, NarL family, nitrate/nitrite sensor histidine kinase NarX